jgi:hypothetical protein
MSVLTGKGLYTATSTYAYEPAASVLKGNDGNILLSLPVVYASSFVTVDVNDGGDPLTIWQGDCFDFGEDPIIFVGALQVCEVIHDEEVDSSIWSMFPPNLKSRLRGVDPVGLFWDPTTGVHIRVSVSQCHVN